MSSTLHYRKMHTLTQQTLGSNWTAENISDQSFFPASCLLRLRGNGCQRGTWESLSLLLSLSLFPSFLFFLCCFVFSLSLTHYILNIVPPCKHKRSQCAGANEYVTWQLGSGSLCFLAWFMYSLWCTLTRFDFMHRMSQCMCVLCMAAEPPPYLTVGQIKVHLVFFTLYS